MKEITYIGEIGGNTHPMVVTLPIDTDTDIKKGTPIFYNKLSVCTLDDTDATLVGICAEDYYCEKNDLVHISGNGQIKVIVSHDAVYEADAIIFASVGSSEGALVWDITEEPSEEAVASMNGSKFILYEKCDASENTDLLGTVYTATCDRIEGPFFYLDCGINGAFSGDKFVFLPPYAYEYLHLKENGEIALDVTKKGNIKVIGISEERRTFTFMLSDII